MTGKMCKLTNGLQNSWGILKKSNCMVTVKFKKKMGHNLHLFPALQKLTHMMISLHQPRAVSGILTIMIMHFIMASVFLYQSRARSFKKNYYIIKIEFDIYLDMNWGWTWWIFFEKVHSLFTHIHNFPFIGMDFWMKTSGSLWG